MNETATSWNECDSKKLEWMRQQKVGMSETAKRTMNENAKE
jgi:hypothetical protein